MSPVTTSSVARQIESLFDGASVAGLTDRQLIDRFTARRDAAGEAAFAALVSRHGPMVMDICRQVMGTPHDAEDAFQAVFLVLACRARSIRNPDLLASWLYAVALRTARKARTQIARRRKKDGAAMIQRPKAGSSLLIDRSVPTPEETLLAREQAGDSLQRDRPLVAIVSLAGRAPLLRGPHGRRHGAPPRLPGRHGP